MWFHKLKKKIKGPVYTPSDPEYEDLVKIDNAHFQIQPKALVLPISIKDIKETIKFAQKHKAKLTVRGGGHSGAGKCQFMCFFNTNSRVLLKRRYRVAHEIFQHFKNGWT